MRIVAALISVPDWRISASPNPRAGTGARGWPSFTKLTAATLI